MKVSKFVHIIINNNNNNNNKIYLYRVKTHSDNISGLPDVKMLVYIFKIYLDKLYSELKERINIHVKRQHALK